jgi:hypothetical protein
MQPFDTLQATLDGVRAGRMGPAALADAARADSTIAALPPRYAEVLQRLLDRLEASALFTEESCSFSQRELLDALQQWIDKARIAAR